MISQEGRALIKRIEITAVGWTTVLASILIYLGMEPTSLIAGSLFMLLNFHALALAGRSGHGPSFILWLAVKAPFFYGLLLLLLSRPGLIDPGYFLAGVTTLILAILTTVLFREVE